MGLRFRKSINLGGGFRINLSKHGVGYSWGVKGARLTKTARGSARTTLSIPGTGISYSTESKIKKSSPQKTSVGKQEVVQSTTPDLNFETVQLSDYVPVEYKEFLHTVNTVRFVNGLGIALLVIGLSFIMYEHPVWGILSIIAGLFLSLYSHIQLPVDMEYEYDEQIKQDYYALCESWKSLSKCKEIKQLIAGNRVDSKTNAGVDKEITKLKNCSIIKKAPYFIRPNIEVFGIKLPKYKIIFLPDKLLVASLTKIRALNYDDINVRIGLAHIVTQGKCPKDSKIVGKRWLKVNKDGSPDKRFKNNKQLNICEYGALILESGEKLHIEIVFSNSSFSEILRDNLKKYFKIN